MVVLARDGRMQLILGSYQPSVICAGKIPGWKSCNAVLYGMEAGLQERVFGDPSDKHTQVALPAEIDSGKYITTEVLSIRKCAMLR